MAPSIAPRSVLTILLKLWALYLLVALLSTALLRVLQPDIQADDWMMWWHAQVQAREDGRLLIAAVTGCALLLGARGLAHVMLPHASGARGSRSWAAFHIALALAGSVLLVWGLQTYLPYVLYPIDADPGDIHGFVPDTMDRPLRRYAMGRTGLGLLLMMLPRLLHHLTAWRRSHGGRA